MVLLSQMFLVLEFPQANPKGRNGGVGLGGFSTPTFFRTNEYFAPGLIEASLWKNVPRSLKRYPPNSVEGTVHYQERKCMGDSIS